MSGEVSYDVYVKKGVDQIGRDEFGEAVAHFVERNNAVALKRRLVARGEMVHVVRRVVHDLSEEEKERRFSDYSRVPEYNLLPDHGFTQERSGHLRTPRWTTPAPSVSMSRRLQRASRNLGGEDGWGRKTDDGRDATISYGRGAYLYGQERVAMDAC